MSKPDWRCLPWIVLLAAMFLPGPALSQALRIPPMRSLAGAQDLQSARLAPAEIKGILKQVEETSFDYPDSWQAELRVRRVSLGATDGLVAGGTKLLCGGTGNCQTWVFRRSGGRWVSMFQHQAPVISGFGFTDQTSHGIKDFTAVANLSAGRSVYSVFEFDGFFYREKHCYEMSDIEAKSRLIEKACANSY